MRTLVRNTYVGFLVVAITASFCLAQEGGEASGSTPADLLSLDSLMTRDSLTGNFVELGDDLEQKGISVGLGLTYIYQVNVKGGLST